MPKASSFSRFTRGVKHTVKAFASTKHPVLVHIVPMRRCNLACTDCNEYDKTSDPVPIDVMLERIDKLAEFGSSVITISGGEPMMHPEIYEIIAFHTNQPVEKVAIDCDRDKWLTSTEAKEYGLIDEVLVMNPRKLKKDK